MKAIYNNNYYTATVITKCICMGLMLRFSEASIRPFDGDDLNPVGQYATNPSQTHSTLTSITWYWFLTSSFLANRSTFLDEYVSCLKPYTSKYLTGLFVCPYADVADMWLGFCPTGPWAFHHLVHILAAECLGSKNSGVAEASNAIRMLFRKAGLALKLCTDLLLHCIFVTYYFCFTRSPDPEWDLWPIDNTTGWWL